MGVNNYVEEVYYEALDYFNEHYRDFAQKIDDKKEELDEWKHQYHVFNTDDDHLEESSTEEELFNIFYKELVEFVSKGIGGDRAMFLANQQMLDDLIQQIISENFDGFCVLYGMN